MRRIFRLILLSLILLAVALVSALAAMRMAIHGREVLVPVLVDLSPADAERLAIKSGLLVQMESRFYSADIAEGRIMSQTPSPGTTVRRGWRVRLAQSMGPQHVVIPDLTGQTVRAAEMNLRRQGLELGSIAVIHLPGYPPDQVVSQNPPANARGIAGPRINLLITAPLVTTTAPQSPAPVSATPPIATAPVATPKAGPPPAAGVPATSGQKIELPAR